MVEEERERTKINHKNSQRKRIQRDHTTVTFSLSLNVFVYHLPLPPCLLVTKGGGAAQWFGTMILTLSPETIND